jgi:4-hydroxy-4-methyl-2-oxoglutarate aldolase
MIKDPPIMSIRRGFTRPRAKDVAAFAGAQTGPVVDAMGGHGALHHRIKPLVPPKETLVGVAVTCNCGPADNLGLFGALDVAKPGDVIVAAADAYTGTATTGDLVMGMYRNKGVVGFITDGMVRDVVGIVAVGIPCYCAGVTPNSPARNGPATVGLPVTLGGVTVESGDIIVADGDGVVVVPRASIGKVIEALKGVRAAEAALEAKVKGGLQVPDFARAFLDSDRTVELP